MSAAITALVPYFGSKRTMAPEIVRELGLHKAYWEPFCGSCAVILAKPKCRMETINDLHGDLVNLARVVRHPIYSRELARLARLVPCADDELRDANVKVKGEPPADAPDVDRALAYLQTSWMGRNGEAGLRPSKASDKLCVRWTNNGGAPGTRWYGVVRSIAYWHRRLAQVTVLRRDGFEILEKIADEPDAAIYCDPPYIVKSDEYLHDFAHEDHWRLAKLLARFKKARVVCSYYRHQLLTELYPPDSWYHKEIAVRKNLSNAGNGNRRPLNKAIEVLLLNGKSYDCRSRKLF